LTTPENAAVSAGVVVIEPEDRRRCPVHEVQDRRLDHRRIAALPVHTPAYIMRAIDGVASMRDLIRV
jgi:hypothetical protein